MDEVRSGGAYPIQWNMLVALPFALLSCAVVSSIIFGLLDWRGFNDTLPFWYSILPIFCICYLICFIASFYFWR